MIRILFVCLGNICRSPMAEGIFIKLLKEEGLTDQFVVESAGTGGWHTGELPDSRMRQTAQGHGIQLVSRARQVSAEDFSRFDYLIPMDSSNFRDLEAIAIGLENPHAQVIKMRYFDQEKVNGDVPDPYYGGQSGFEDVYNILNRSCTALLQYLKKQHELV